MHRSKFGEIKRSRQAKMLADECSANDCCHLMALSRARWDCVATNQVENHHLKLSAARAVVTLCSKLLT
jgi:hypothetical protein